MRRDSSELPRAAPPRSHAVAVRRTLLTAGLTTTATLLLLAVAVVGANFAWPALAFWSLLLVPLTVGLPTTFGVVAITAVWNGPPLWLWAGCAAAAGFALQCSTQGLLRKARRPR